MAFLVLGLAPTQLVQSAGSAHPKLFVFLSVKGLFQPDQFCWLTTGSPLPRTAGSGQLRPLTKMSFKTGQRLCTQHLLRLSNRLQILRRQTSRRSIKKTSTTRGLLTRVKSQWGPGVRKVNELPRLRGYLRGEKRSKVNDAWGAVLITSVCSAQLRWCRRPSAPSPKS